MKKTILAIAIPALFASAANAATVYDKDGAKFDVYGRVHAAYQGKENLSNLDITKDDDFHFVKDEESKNEQVYTYARFGMQGKVALNNTWSAVAQGEWQVNGEESDEDQFKSRHILAGFDGSQYGKFLFGQTDTASKWGVQDRADIFEELGNNASLNDGRQEGQVIYRGEWDGIFANASYITKNSSYKSGERFAIEKNTQNPPTPKDANDAGLKSGYALGAGYNMPNGFGFGASMESKEFDRGTDVTARTIDNGVFVKKYAILSDIESKDDWAVGASYAYDAFYVGAMYNQSKLKGYDDGDQIKAKGYEIAGSYTIDAWKLLAGYNFLEAKVSDNTFSSNDIEMFNRVILGVEYAFTSNIKSYANYAIESAGQKDDQWEFGLQYNF
ncbi:porin [Aeromonas sobria]|uniref:porin n=1 Tax=Aeromonas sobria TaxID=646 RepID=UPI00111BAC2D|nr:porin [Aeromonas sobria]TNJ16713.1 porin [Aeromonas sobria]